MKLSPLDARERFVSSPVARLATADAHGVPHVVPVTFAVLNDVVYFAVDHKPKSTWALRRLRNIEENPSVTVLVDHYDEDWSTLWWARADGRGEVLPEDGQERRGAVGLLCGKYQQYKDSPPQGPVVAVRVERWSGWAFTQPALAGRPNAR
ncbi:TIGR03668 family PPOX class F420-dependent oxidoreductase [Streptomyces sp. NPDC048275]|uniref:TIGR03668 family PPOX class F420-dependent oxidoreductase n=1 Tax=Streptomyces sp. NPDC048275 TaxID=3155629 RepID=UPI0034083A06